MTLSDVARSRSSTLFLAFGVAAAVVFVLAQGHPAAQAVVYLAVCAAQSVAVVHSVRRRRPSCRAGWRALAAGVSLFSVANAIWFGYPVLLGGTLPFPSVADPLFFLSYGCTAAGLVHLVRCRSSEGERAGALVDSAVITVAGAFVVWHSVLAPRVTASTGSVPQRLVAIGYPLFDLALLALVSRMMFTRGASSRSFWLVGGFVVLQLSGDLVYAVSVLNGTFDYGDPATTLWTLSYALIGAAALHPSMAVVGNRAPEAAPRGAPLVRLAVVTAAAAFVPGVAFFNARVDGPVLHATALALVLLGAARMALVVRELQRQKALVEGRERELLATVALLNRSEEDLAHQAHHDSLTGLPNRALFQHRLDRALAGRGRPVAVMLLDLDGFKTVNDSLGHAVGDAMLVEVARRLGEALRGSDVVARLGGDEFTVLAEGVDTDGAVELARRVLDALDAPMPIHARNLFCQASVGIATAIDGSHSASELLRDADAAMYAAKRRGGRRYEVFTADLHARALDRLALETDLRGVGLGSEMTVHYQPMVDLGSGRVMGFEALLRWDHPDRGPIAPVDFVGIAEETGAIIPIGRWVIEEACRQTVAWQRAYGRPELGVNVNVSARQLADRSIVDDVARVLAETGLAPSLLTLEITETMIMADEDEARACLCRLKGLGVRISVDDFGTGYSSLGHLDRFPIDELKIDRSFIAGLGRGGDGSSVACAAIRLARSLHLDVVAEGVERDEQVSELRRTSCARAQGYLFSRPIPAASAGTLLAADRPAALPPAPKPVVLVVDDDEAVRESVSRILRANGFRTLAAATGAQALQAAATTPLDAIVLDVALPDFDGYEVSRRLAATRLSVPTVYLSGAATGADDRARGFDAGGDCYLLKPFAPRELVAAVRAVLRGRGDHPPVRRPRNVEDAPLVARAS